MEACWQDKEEGKKSDPSVACGMANGSESTGICTGKYCTPAASKGPATASGRVRTISAKDTPSICCNSISRDTTCINSALATENMDVRN